MIRQPRAHIVVVGDTPAFGKTVAAILTHSDSTARLRHTTYENFIGLLTPRLIRDTDIFLLELWRTYPMGLRAEGMSVAEVLIQRRAVPLVISSLAFGPELDLPWYWDLGSVDTLVQRCQLLGRGAVRPPLAAADGLKTALACYTSKLHGHDTDANTITRESLNMIPTIALRTSNP